jgi:hypothetical protein
MYPESERLFGRSAELARLRDAFATLRLGRGQLVLLEGEPGIGKTRLAEEFCALARDGGAVVAWGAAWDGGGAPSYWPWTQLLRGLRALLPEPSEALRRDLGPLWEGGAEAEGDDVEAAHFRRCDALRALLATAAARTPLVLVLDDLHAADRATLQGLHFVARALRSLPLMIVGTHRDGDARLRPDVTALLERVAREGVTLSLGRLERGAVQELVGEQGARTAELAELVYEASGGNPFFAREVLRSLASGATSKRIPDGVRALLGERMAAFDPEARSALEAAAVLGRELSLATLATLCGATRPELDERLRAPRLSALMHDAEPDSVCFAHPLFREYLYDGLDRRQRARLHLRAAESLMQQAPLALADEESIARHLLLALPEGDVGRAVTRARAAAQSSVRALAFDRAVELLEGALGAARDQPEAVRLDLELELAQAQVLIGQGERSRRICAAVAERARRLDDPERLARAALAYGSEIRVGIRDPLQDSLLAEALGALGSSDPALSARLMARLAATRQPSPQPAAAIALAHEAIALARSTGDTDALVYALHMGGSALASYEAPSERRRVSRELAALTLQRHELVLAQRAHQRLAIDAGELGDLEGVKAAVTAQERLGQVLGHPRFRWEAALLRSYCALIEGRWAESSAAIAEAGELVSELEEPVVRELLIIHRFGALRARASFGAGALERGLAQLSELVLANETMVAVCMSSVYARAGELALARSALSRVKPVAGWLLCLPLAMHITADAAVRLRDHDVCRQLQPLLAALPFPANTWGRSGYLWEGFVSEVTGGMLGVLERWDEAVDELDSAIEAAEVFRARPALVESRISLAEVLRLRGQSGDEARAAHLLTLAERDGAELDMQSSLERIRRQREQTRAPRPSTPAAVAPTLELSREGEIWTLTSQEGSTRLKHSRALDLLKQLVDQPGREFHVLDLGAPGEGEEVIDVGDAGEIFDQPAKGAYLQRVGELRAELAEAEGWNDSARRARVQAELEFLEDELGRGSGAGGKLRRSAGAAERARVNVHKRLRGLIKKIAVHLPGLAHHLEACVKTGTFVSYQP